MARQGQDFKNLASPHATQARRRRLHIVGDHQYAKNVDLFPTGRGGTCQNTKGALSRGVPISTFPTQRAGISSRPPVCAKSLQCKEDRAAGAAREHVIWGKAFRGGTREIISRRWGGLPIGAMPATPALGDGTHPRRPPGSTHTGQTQRSVIRHRGQNGNGHRWRRHSGRDHPLLGASCVLLGEIKLYPRCGVRHPLLARRGAP